MKACREEQCIGKWSASHSGYFTPRKENEYPVKWEALWALEPVWKFCRNLSPMSWSGCWIFLPVP